ncbi:LAETG motif-containing sortase-dependent surface protein [Streptomyces sp. NPDC059373]
MSISRRVTMRRLLGVSAAALALSVAGSTAAYACEGGSGWNKGTPAGYKPGNGGGTKTSTDKCEFSVDGTNWYASVKVDDINLKAGDDGKVHVKVRTSSDSASCTASLASYRTHGATFETSGKQVFHDWDTATVKSGQTDTLDVAFPDVGCFAQVDLYYGNTKYDGDYNANDGYTHGDLPEGPDHAVIGDKKIAWWNGGTKDCTAQVIPSSSPSESASASESATPSASASTTPSSGESSPAASASASASDVAASASASASSGDLAETGSNGTGALAAGAAVLVAAGAGVLFATRRRQAARRH